MPGRRSPKPQLENLSPTLEESEGKNIERVVDILAAFIDKEECGEGFVYDKTGLRITF